MTEGRAPSRRRQILEALAHELEASPGSRITTARLAEAVGVSEAALYRHFPSKARMFEGLFEFAEDSVFGLLNQILVEGVDLERKLNQSLLVLLRFAEVNPGIARVLLGEALVGEHERLRQRSEQFFERFEAELRQALRANNFEPGAEMVQNGAAVASLLSAAAEGRIARFSRTGYRRKPTDDWQTEWTMLREAVLRRSPVR